MTATLLILPGSTANAQHSHDEDHSHSEVTADKNFTAALREIGERMNTLNALLEKENWARRTNRLMPSAHFQSRLEHSH